MHRLILVLFIAPSFAVSQDPLELEELIYLVDSGLSEEQIIQEVRTSPVQFRLDETIEKRLQQAGVPDRVLQVLRQRQAVNDLVTMRREGKTEIDLIQSIVDRGTVYELFPEEIRLLYQQHCSVDVVNALQGRFGFHDFRTHEHPGGFFRVQHPEWWKKIEEFQDDKVIVAYTPQQDRTSTRTIDTGFRVELNVVGAKSPHSYLPLETINRNILKRTETEQKEAGDPLTFIAPPRNFRVQGVPAVLNDYEHAVHGVKVRRQTILLFYNGIEYWLSLDAPSADFERLRGTFQRILITFNPAPSEIGQKIRKRTANHQELLEKYRPAVVKVIAQTIEGGQVSEWGWGTGFFIRKDGYLLTNHHVVYNERLGRFADKFLLEWDDTLGRPQVEAKLIDAVYSEYPNVDVALLKAKGSDYVSLPVTRVNPAHKNVKQSDRVMALGYPAVVEGRPKEEMPTTLTATLGILAKFNLRQDRSVNEMITTALIHKGNSGGPCFDLETHSVIGLNTFGRFDPMAEDVRVYVFTAYGGVIPIDAAFEAFPEIVCYPESVEAKFRPEDYVSLAIQFLNQGLYKAAWRQTEKALLKKPEFAEAIACQGDIQAARRVPREAVDLYQQTLAIDPQNVRALMGMAALVPGKALECYTRVIQLRPKNHRSYDLRARLHLKEGRLEEARRDARMAAECCAELYSKPYCLLGELLYSEKNFEEGREQYEKACRIDPHDIEARFGLVQYYAVQGRFEKAMPEVDAIAAESKNDPSAQKLSGDSYWMFAQRLEKDGKSREATQSFEKAYLYYRQAMTLYEARQQPPDNSMLLRYAWIAHQRMGDTWTALTLYQVLTQGLISVLDDGRRVNTPDLQNVYFNVGLIYQKQWMRSQAEGFSQAAADLDPDSDLGKQAEQQVPKLRTKLTLNDVSALVFSKFSVYAVADVVLASPLAFAITQKEALSLRETGWPPVVISALIRASSGKARDLNAILKSWMEKDKALIAEAKSIPFDERSARFKELYKEHADGRFDVSVPGFKKIFYRFADDDQPLAVIAAYNVACAYSLQKQKGEALDWLELSFYCGLFNDERDMVERCEKDADLEFLRDDPRYKAVIAIGRKLRRGGQATTEGGTVGIKLKTLTEEEREELELPRHMGVLVTALVKEGPAEKAGLQVGDVVCMLDGDPTADADRAIDWIGAKPAATKISVFYLRAKKFQEVVVDVQQE